MYAVIKSLKLIFLISGVLILLLSPVVFYFFASDQLDNIHPLAFESVDTNNPSVFPGQSERIIAPISISDQVLNKNLTISVQVLDLFFNLPSPDSKPTVLRC